MQHVTEIVHLWRQLRAPFPLPLVTAKCHVCEWEKIEIDVLGCVLCGNVHACSYGTCNDVTETSDGLVCELSGVVIYSKRYVETEFMDTLCVTGTDIPELQAGLGDVEQIVTTLLCSHRQARSRRSLLLATLDKCCCQMDRQLRHNKNAMTACMKMLSHFSTMPYLFVYMSDDDRQRIIGQAVENCCRVLHILAKHGMHVRNNEIQRLSVGIVYLMRYGVIMDGVFILPRIKDLQMLLPPETSLLPAYGIHPKYITEMENRLKFCLRHGS